MNQNKKTQIERNSRGYKITLAELARGSDRQRVAATTKRPSRAQIERNLHGSAATLARIGRGAP